MLRIKNKSVYVDIINIIVFAYFLFLYVVRNNAENALFANTMRVLFALCFLLFVMKWSEIRLPHPVVLSGAFVLYAGLSLTWAYYRQTDAMFQIFLNFILSTLLLQCVRSRRHLEFIIKSMAICGTGVCVLILTNADLHSLNSRITVEGFNVNTLGILLIFSGLCCWYLYLTGKEKIWLALLFPYICFSLLTGSKKVLVMLGTVVLLYIIWMNKRTLKGFLTVLFLMIVVIAGIYAIFNIPFLYNVIGKRMGEFLQGLIRKERYNASDLMRENMIKRALELFLQHPVRGIGVANFERMNRYKVYSHCNYTEILCNYGLIGFILYYSRNAYYIFLYLRMEKERRKDELSRLAIAIMGIYLLIDFAMVSYYSLFHQTILGLIYYMLVYAAEKRKAGEKH